MFKRYDIGNFKFRLLIYVYAITVIGILLIGSADASYQSQQVLGMVLGTAVMLVAAFVDYTWILRFYWIIYLANLMIEEYIWCIEFSFVRI